MKKFVLPILCTIITLAAIVFIGGWLYYQSLYNDYMSVSQVPHEPADDSLATNSIARYSNQEIMIYGKWSEQQDPLNFKVFTLDDAGDGFYWGKEWSEGDNVFEDDLENHGSGWFRWKAKKNNILFLYQTNLGLTIPSECKLLQIEDEQLGLQGKFSRSADLLNRVYN